MKLKLSLISILFSLCYFLWVLMPMFCAEYLSDSKKIFFYGIYGVAILLSFISNKFKIYDREGLVLICLLMIVFFFMKIFNYKDSAKYFNVIVLFWITFVFNAVLNKKSKILLVKILIGIMIIIFVTSFIGLIQDSNSARILSYAASDEKLQIFVSKKNIASLFFYQSIVILNPCILLNLKNNKKLKYIYILSVFLLLFLASFSITVIIFIIFTVFIFIYEKYSKSKNKFLIFLGLFLIVFIFIINGESILNFLIKNINNLKISQRLEEILCYIYKKNSFIEANDLSERLSLYKSSLNTFLENPFFGVGPYYSFIKLKDGIGYHSQILDDLARYGISALIFYILFFKAYYRLLIKNWKMKEGKVITILTILTYILFLILNIGFRSEYESIVVFLIIPNLPLVINERKKRSE